MFSFSLFKSDSTLWYTLLIFIITVLQRAPDPNQKSLVYIEIMNMNDMIREINESDLVNDVQF